MAPSTPPDARRRGFLRGRGARRPIRPPWALAEAAFVDRCTRCHACVERCPEQVLVAADGGFPEFDPGRGGCTFCGDCVDACGPAVLDRPAGARPWDLRATISEDCFGAHGIVCQSCRDDCEAGALQFAPGGRPAAPRLDLERCTGCGACVASCPGHAITLRRPAEAVAA